MTFYGTVTIAFGVLCFATAIYKGAQRDWRTAGLGLLATVVLVGFGIWMLGQ
jgi:hypothetical protein